MDETTKFQVGRWLIACAVLLVLLWPLYESVSVGIVGWGEPLDPHSGILDVLGLVYLGLMASGLYMASRAIGVPISLKYLLYLLVIVPPVRWVWIAFIITQVSCLLYLMLAGT